jgi:hypothetical protein
MCIEATIEAAREKRKETRIKREKKKRKVSKTTNFN